MTKTKTKKLPHQKAPLIVRFFRSFHFAGKGFLVALKERNMKVHVFITILVVLAGLYFGLAPLEWAFVVILIGLVLSAEIVNTSIEGIADLLRDDLNLPYKATGRVRDLAAAAVLVLAIVAAILGGLIFYPYIYNWLS